MSKLNEREIIKIFKSDLGNSKSANEDVEVFKIGQVNIVCKVDTLVASTDIPHQMSIKDAVRKSVVACVSDFASKAVRPQYGMVSVTIPKKFSKQKIKEITTSLGKAAKEFKIKIIGGDTNEGKELVISVSIYGTTKKIVLRKGAKVGDKIFTTGPFGYTSAGLAILLKKKKGGSKFSSKAKKSVFSPSPKLDFGISCGKFFSSAMDSSDGLSTTLHEMARQSKKKFYLTSLPTTTDLYDFAKKNRIDPLKLIFNGGEEYEIVFTANSKNISKIKKYAKSHRVSLFEIGYVENGLGVQYKSETKTKKIQDKGWVHFRN